MGIAKVEELLQLSGDSSTRTGVLLNALPRIQALYTKLTEARPQFSKTDEYIMGGSWVGTPGYMLRKLMCEHNIFPYKLNSNISFNGVFLASIPTNIYTYTNTKSPNCMILVNEKRTHIIAEFNFNDEDSVVHIIEYSSNLD